MVVLNGGLIDLDVEFLRVVPDRLSHYLIDFRRPKKFPVRFENEVKRFSGGKCAGESAVSFLSKISSVTEAMFPVDRDEILLAHDRHLPIS